MVILTEIIHSLKRHNRNYSLHTLSLIPFEAVCYIKLNTSLPTRTMFY